MEACDGGEPGVWHPNLAFIQWLIEKGADVKAKDNVRYTFSYLPSFFITITPSSTLFSPITLFGYTCIVWTYCSSSSFAWTRISRDCQSTY